MCPVWERWLNPKWKTSLGPIGRPECHTERSGVYHWVLQTMNSKERIKRVELEDSGTGITEGGAQNARWPCVPHRSVWRPCVPQLHEARDAPQSLIP